MNRQGRRAAFLGSLLVASLASGAEDQPVEEHPEQAEAVTGAIELRDGTKARGSLSIRDGSVVVVAADDTSVSSTLDGLARLEVAAVEPPGKKQETVLEGALPAPWRSRDMGRLVTPGRTRWKDGQFVLQASPKAEGEMFSAFHMAYRPLDGDGEIVARVVRIENPDEDAYGGIIMCVNPTPNSHKALLSVTAHGETGVSFRRWGFQGGSSTGKEDPAIKLPYWLKLVRTGRDVKAYYSPNGHHWKFLKESTGKMYEDTVYVGLAARAQKFDRLSEVVIDHVSINGEGSQPVGPMLPRIVLRNGSVLAADIARADATALRFRGRWEGAALTLPRVARVEFFHPLPADAAKLIDGSRAGLLLRSGDFAEGQFAGLADGQVQLGSLLFGVKDYSILDEVDAIVLRSVEAGGEASMTIETHAGSVLRVDQATLAGDRLEVSADGLGSVSFALAEVKAFTRARNGGASSR